MEALLIVLLVLALVTLVGHGIWIGLAALGRSLTGAGEVRGRVERDERCPGCGARLNDRERDCPNCGLVRDGARARQLRDLAVARRQVDALYDRGELDH